MNILDLAIKQATMNEETEVKISTVIDNMIKIRRFFDRYPAVVKYFNGVEVSRATARKFQKMGL
jgi:hypothetical protein